MIAGNTLFDSWGGFSWSVKLSDEDIANIEVLREAATETIYWLSMYGVHIAEYD